jgi:leucine dehydrogenase
VFDEPDFKRHESVNFICDHDSGLKAILAILDTRLGPAIGGCRVWQYENEGAALGDALRLSRGMGRANNQLKSSECAAALEERRSCTLRTMSSMPVA